MSGSDLNLTRSFALIGHAGDGKTTLADSLVMAAGVTTRLGSVDEGSSFMNYQPEEQKRRVSVSASICSFERDGYSHTVLDAPGDSNFAGESVSAVQAVDCGVLVLSAQDGVKVGTEKVYRLARELGLAVVGVANKMDLDRADFDACATQIEERLGVRVVKLHLPIGRAQEYRGYVDLLSRRACIFSPDASGRATSENVPADLADAVEEAHMAMVEAIAEADDAVLEKYLEEGNIDEEELLATLRTGTHAGAILPIISSCSSANIGGGALLELAEKIFPCPADIPARKARRGEEEIELSATADAPVVAHVFKSIADRYAGVLSIFRVCSGTLRTDMTVVNARTGTKERISKILRLSGEHTEETTEVGPGGIAAIPKLKDTHTGDSLTEDKKSVQIEGLPVPRGVISFAIEVRNKGEEEKVFESLNKLVEEDRSLQLGREEETGEFLLTGLGQLHIEVTLDKLRRLFKVEVDLKPPKVPYHETIKGRAEHVEGKLKKQSGGRGQFGVCFLSVEPGERGTGVQFLDEIVGGSIPRQFIPAVEKGVREACGRGILAGYPVTDIMIHCVDGKHHSVDSSEMAFKTAGSMGVKKAVQEAKPTLLEPIMEMEVSVPDDFVGDVMGNLNSRRGRVAGVEARGAMQSVRAQVPMSEVLTYASDLTSITGGQGSFTMEFSHYGEVPKEVQEKIIAAAKPDAD